MINMPFAGFNDWDDCVDTMTEEEGYDKETAEKICGSLQAEEEKEQGSPEKLLNAINNGAKSILNELGLKNFSFVDNPAQPSKFVRMKSDDDKIKVENRLVRKEDKDDWSVVYGAVMIPNEVDKQGDVIPAHTIEEAAHQFLKEKRTDEIDSEHKLITNKGNLVESWILEEDKKYEAVDGEEIVYEKGTWMVGVEPNDEIKAKIDSGELKGFSIYGNADGVEIDKLRKDDVDKQDDTINEVEYDVARETSWDGVDQEEFPSEEDYRDAHVVLFEDDEALPIVHFEDDELVLVYEALNSAYDTASRVDGLSDDEVEEVRNYLEDLKDREFPDREPLDKQLKNEGFSFGDFMDEDEIKEMRQDINEIKESFEELEEVKEELKMQDDEEEKQEEENNEEKQEFEDIGEVIDWLDENAPDEVVEMVQDAMQSSETDEDMEEDEEEKDKEEDKESKSKGHNGEGTRKSMIEEKEEETAKGIKSIKKMIKEDE